MLDTIKWNILRNDLKFDIELEVNMLAEEAQEFKDGLIMYVKAETQKEKLDGLVEMIDAYCDFKFVLIGTYTKSLGSTFDYDAFKHQEGLMEHLLDQANFGRNLRERCYGYVLKANMMKPINKTDAKVEKGADWKDPKDRIWELAVDYV